MYTYRDLVYMVFDELKINSDDSVWETDHVVLLLNKYRNLILRQRYGGIKKDVPLANYQQILFKFPQGTDVKSINKVPQIINFNGLELEASLTYYSIDKGDASMNINFIPIDRFKFIKHNKWLQKESYAAIGYDGYIYAYFPSGEPFQLMLNAVLENPMDAINYMEPDEQKKYYDPIDLVFPLDMAHLQSVIELTTKELGASVFLPEDTINNASDDTNNMHTKKR